MMTKLMAQHIVALQKEKGELTDRCRELEGKLTKVREEIIKALKECTDDEWLSAHNGKARYVYLQSVMDIVNEKFEEADNDQSKQRDSVI